MRSIEKFLIVAILAYGISKVLVIGAPWVTAYFQITNADASQLIFVRDAFEVFAYFIFNLVVAIWTYIQAKKEKTNPILWLLMALFLGVLGLILFYSYFAYVRTKSQSNPSQQDGLLNSEQAPPPLH